MKKCPVCNKVDINEKYAMCLTCLKEVGTQNKEQTEVNDLSEIKELIQKINWNMGAISKYLRLYFLYNICGKGASDIKSNIYELFKKNIEKDFKHLEDIEKELEK